MPRITCRSIIVSLAALLALAGCGAPTKSAGDVESLFSEAATSLQDKETKICSTLASRAEVPTIKNSTLDMAGCRDAGLAAVDYQRISNFYFYDLVPPPTSTSGVDVIHRTVRGQVWLNKSLLGLAGSLSQWMKKQKAKGGLAGALQNPASGNDKLTNIVKPTLEVLEEPKFDLKNLSLSAKLHIALTGIVTADHVVAIDGKMIDNVFAITVKTTEDRAFSQSILKNFQTVILIIPHASDVYVDMFIDVNTFNFGVPAVVNDKLTSFLSSALKTLLDGVLQNL